MSNTTRRDFLTQASTGVAGAMSLNAMANGVRAAGANDRVVLAMIGCGGRMRGLINEFASRQGQEVAYLCDPDSEQLARAKETLKNAGQNKQPKTVKDMREVFDDKSVDAVVVATPDHWHAPTAILACEAKKHAYVEKPVSHNLHEGRLLVEAARKHQRIIQHGTQSRSNPLIAEGIQMLKEGIIGDVLIAKAWNVQKRSNIGHAKPSDAPGSIDYDMWVGPAEFLPYQSNRLHYNWHWWHNFGTGDMGNDGAHELDYARWGLGVETQPSRISGLGGKYFFDDDQEYPDTQQVAFEYPGNGETGQRRMLVWEMRIWSTNYPHNVDNGVEFYGSNGRMLLSKRGKLQVFGKGVKSIEAKLKGAKPELMGHADDFLDSIRNNRRPNADIETAHLSASLCHLGNIATRVGRTLEFDPQQERVLNDDEAQQLISRQYREGGHWAIPSAV